MNKKNDIQKEIDNLKQQIDNLTKRREVLQAEHKKQLAGIEEKKRLIGDAILEDRDISQESTALSLHKAKLDGLTEAIKQADARLFDLVGKHTVSLDALAQVDFDALADETKELFMVYLDKLYSSVNAQHDIDAKLAEIVRMGKNVDDHDQLRLVRRIYQHLGKDISEKLFEIEREYSNLLASIRQKKSG